MTSLVELGHAARGEGKVGGGEDGWRRRKAIEESTRRAAWQ